MKEKKWIQQPFSPEKVRQLAQEMGIPDLVARVLCARGLYEKDVVDRFFSLDDQQLEDPFLLPQMTCAVACIRRAMEQKKKIVVFGDYDVDGITATCVLVDYLRGEGAWCEYYIPDRLSEGYGLNGESIRHLAAQGMELLITVDSGITAVEEVELAQQLGVSVVVTDHHQCKDRLPPAQAVVNPQMGNVGKNLAGVGVAFKLACALAGGAEMQVKLLRRYADLVAVGTIADVMPLYGENRLIASTGIEMLKHTKNEGLASLIRLSGSEKKKMTSSLIGFTLAPRINAAGRIGCAAQGAEMLLTHSAARADTIARLLCEQNRQRQEAESEILRQALEKLSREFDPETDPVIVVWGENWHHGVIGIVSSRLCDIYGRPVILISLDGDCGKGSGRSVGDFNLFRALEFCAPCLLKYGGHEMAAGLTIDRSQLETFRDQMRQYAASHPEQCDVRQPLSIDCEVATGDLSYPNIRALEMMEPYGMGNPQPLFMMTDMRVEEITPISSDKHSKLLLSKDGMSICAMWFGITSTQCGFVPGSMVDVVFHADINEFRGRSSIQMLVKDIRLSRCELEADDCWQQAYQRYINGDSLTEEQVQGILPDRGDLVAVWRHVISRAEKGRLMEGVHALCRKIQWESKKQINMGKTLICLDVFSESRLIDYHDKQDVLFIKLLSFEGKADISQSVVLATLQNMKRAESYER